MSRGLHLRHTCPYTP